MGSNQSMAIWCERAPAATNKISFEVHFNYWCIQKDGNGNGKTSIVGRKSNLKSKNDFTEVGLMIDNPSDVHSVAIFIPAKLERSSISDCAPYFQNENVVQGIFNEQITTTALPGGKHLLLKKANGHLFSAMHLFANTPGSTELAAAELSVDRRDGGTLCRVQPAVFAAAAGRKLYLRLRFELPRDRADNPFVEPVEIPDAFLLTARDEIEYLDFRLNEARTLPTPIEVLMAAEQPAGSVNLKLVAFLTAIPVQSEVSVANSEFHKMRVLEDSIWLPYAEGVPPGMVVYHWKKTSKVTKPIVDFSAFVKLQTRRSGTKVLLTYLGFAFAFGVFGNLFASYLEGCVSSLLLWIGTIFTEITGYLPRFSLPPCDGGCSLIGGSLLKGGLF